ncbi:MAG: universal stress protein [Thermodesulfobacteriota bacterium]|nr:MAG: universal stress protein [Thermodesulfobacteriota bacterium]
MVEVKKILFPVDFYESAVKILPVVKLMAEKMGAKIELIHVVKGSSDFVGYEMGAAWYSNFEDELIKGGEKAMDKFVEEKLAGLVVDTTVAVGDAAEEIIKYADKTGADMIIIGTHGRKGLEKILFGSVALGVVKGAHCPVLTVNPHKVSK